MIKKDKTNESNKITTDENFTVKDQMKSKEGMREILLGGNAIYKPLKEAPSECNPDNGAWFEEKSNPLSSKGN